jgi:glycosyltransferase involved in cell wall biosynthesis
VLDDGAPCADEVGAPRIVAFPRGSTSYTDCFNDALEAAGAQVVDGIYSGRWILAQLPKSDAFQFHWPSFYYYVPGQAIRSWLRLGKFALFLATIRCCGRKVFWTAHNLYPHDGGRALRVHRAGRWLMCRVATRIFAHGRIAAEIVCRRLGATAGKLRVIEHGNWIGYYPNACTQLAAREKLGIGAVGRVFLFVGICKPYKNLEVLIAAFQSLPSGSTLVIAGKFQDSAYRRMVELAISRKPEGIVLHGRFLEDHELQYYLNLADCVVLPYSETLTSGGAMLALTFGRPVIAPRLGGLAEIVDAGCGILYDAREAQGLLTAMQSFSTEAFDTRQIQQRARQFSWQRSALVVLKECQR